MTDTDAEPDAIAMIRAAREREGQRVAALIRRDQRAARQDARRAAAETEVADGVFVNLDDTIDGPTPEQRAKGDFRLHTVEKRDGTVRSSTAMRRVLPDRLIQLYNRGVLDDDTFPACAWYRKAWEETGLGITVSASNYTPAISGGTGRRDHLPKSAIGWEAWEDYRYARDGIPAPFRVIVDMVVLDNETIDDAARRAMIGFRNASATFRHGVFALHAVIKHRLPVRQL